MDFIECNGGMIGVEVNSGDNHIDMYFVPKGFKAGALLTGTGIVSLMTLIIIDLKRKKVHE